MPRKRDDAREPSNDGAHKSCPFCSCWLQPKLHSDIALSSS
eukprot:CAMPEP_0206509960 /NCGR_PEP_ID=MMETSP0324_2-20121206/59301_1 /ASSEMBLY_ACC=CAM_ASM_000836 /TAXON_ID=2866 /ORGANISM="Crypthecodinium cohnii, Strain Seligo" /LENGTH=40 /DNA_ID= /DNA_START= /DNA_END= /DNA_ORIENTATION=